MIKQMHVSILMRSKFTVALFLRVFNNISLHCITFLQMLRTFPVIFSCQHFFVVTRERSVGRVIYKKKIGGH